MTELAKQPTTAASNPPVSPLDINLLPSDVVGVSVYGLAPTVNTQSIDHPRKCGRNLLPAGVIQIVARERLAPGFQHPNQPTFFNMCAKLLLR